LCDGDPGTGSGFAESGDLPFIRRRTPAQSAESRLLRQTIQTRIVFLL
jgi:hypothetical protein